MIPDSLFYPQLEDIERLLKRLNLLAERQKSPNSALGAAEMKGKAYREQYELMFRELAYNFRMGDQSLLRFTRSGEDIHVGTLSYCYYESPVSVMSYESFVAFYADVAIGTREHKEALKEVGSELASDYEDYISNADLKKATTPLRYDYKAEDYRAGIHPASHVHFGSENDIRVGTKRIMTPLAFVLFIIRQRYPVSWDKLQHWNNHAELCRNVRGKLDEVDANYWNDLDEQELFLN